MLNGKYRLTQRVGGGSYGIVYAATHCFTGAQYAVKIILKNNSTSTSNNKQLLVELEKNLVYQALLHNGALKANLLNLDLIERHGAGFRFLREISLQLKVHKHPNVLSIYKVYDFDNCIFVVMDYFPEGDLFATIVDKQRYKDDPFLVKSVFIQMVDAINYCHSKNVFHCDLKPENVLVADNGTRVVLADFGLALQEKYIDSNISCGSSYYMSPERIQNFSQAYDTLSSHSIHIERLLDPANHQNDYIHHGNVKFPTASGDVWSLAIILINLICIRNPWLKASFHDPTFKAFVQNPKVLMKILPISVEVFDILINYLDLNPWQRGELFQFRSDVLHCNKLTESGPLSINSSLGALDVITTESQINPEMMGHFNACPVPIDHVALERSKSKDHIEIEQNYIPESNKNDPLNNDEEIGGGELLGLAQHPPNCIGCDQCNEMNLDFNKRFGGGNESGTSLMTLSTSYSNYSPQIQQRSPLYATGTSSSISSGSSTEHKINKFSDHQAQLETEKRKAQQVERDYQLQLHNERKRQREAQRQQRLQHMQQQQQLKLQQQQQRERQILQLQQQKQLKLQQQQQQQQQSNHNGLLSKIFRHHHSPPPAQPQEKPVITEELTQFFPMPGMGHNAQPIISETESRRKKILTKKRQRKPRVSVPLPTQAQSQQLPVHDQELQPIQDISDSALSAMVNSEDEVRRLGEDVSGVSITE